MGLRILVIEDNPTNLDLISYLLTAYGNEVLTATDGTAGIGVARRLRPDLIICDIQMPGVDGYEVARRLRSFSGTADIPLVAVTALAMVDDRRKVMAAGFNGYIAKPIEPESFMQQLAQFAPGQASVLPPHGAAAAEVKPPAPAAYANTGPLILVVDNSPDNRAFARTVLESGGYRVICTEDVTAGLAIAQRDRPALILSDLHMPGGSGFDLLRAVRSDPQLGSIPFVGISSTVWPEEDRARATALGAQGFLYRPIEPQTLLAEIVGVLGGG
jgi:two-component system cell cycle response regulator